LYFSREQEQTKLYTINLYELLGEINEGEKIEELQVKRKKYEKDNSDVETHTQCFELFL
jgi:hypothetical protein